jgi:pentatricopeptide repeat protein
LLKTDFSNPSKDDLTTPLFPMELIMERLELVEFGRAPDPDYSQPIEIRRQQNIEKAEQLYHDLLEKKLKPNVVTLTAYMSVYSEALNVTKTIEIFDKFEEYNIEPNVITYRALIRLFIRKRNIAMAIDIKNEILAKGMMPDGICYGMIIENLTRRQMIIEALKMLEEAHDNKVTIPDNHIVYLRNHCKNLNIKHPNMPADPQQWVKDMHDYRHSQKGNRARGSSLQRLESKVMFGR